MNVEVVKAAAEVAQFIESRVSAVGRLLFTFALMAGVAVQDWFNSPLTIRDAEVAGFVAMALLAFGLCGWTYGKAVGGEVNRPVSNAVPPSRLWRRYKNNFKFAFMGSLVLGAIGGFAFHNAMRLVDDPLVSFTHPHALAASVGLVCLLAGGWYCILKTVDACERAAKEQAWWTEMRDQERARLQASSWGRLLLWLHS